jgi:hypothetical protein
VSDFYAAWKSQHGIKEGKPRDWTKDLTVGEIVVAVEDLWEHGHGGACVETGTRGKVLSITDSPHMVCEWIIQFPEADWHCWYDPEDMEIFEGEIINTEIVPLVVWENRHKPIEEIFNEPQTPLNNPDAYDGGLL